MMFSSTQNILIHVARQYEHSIFILSSRVLECIVKVGRYDVDCMLGLDSEEL